GIAAYRLELARVTVFVSGDDCHGSPSADQGACFLRGRSRPRSAAGRSTAEARLALARLPSRLLDRARLPWSDWAPGYVGLVGKEGAAHVLFSASRLNPQHATFMNVTFGSSFDANDTHVGAMLHPGVAVWSAALATAEHVGQSGPQVLAAVVAGYETIIRIG